MKLHRPEPAWMYVMVAAIVGAVFVLDLFAPLGVVGWVLHVPAVIVCKLATWRRNAPLAVAGAASALVVTAYLLSSHSSTASAQLSVLNRSIGIVALLMVGAMGRHFVANRTAVANQAWLEAGQIGLSRRMSGEQTPAALGSNVLAYLADYVEAQVGSIYTSSAGSLRRCAGFARTGDLANGRDAFAPGEGLIGQAALSEHALVVDDVPAGYVEVRSGVGAASPRTLVLVPARADGEVEGVLELGFFTPPQAEVRAFLTAVADSIGVAFRTARYRALKAELLAQTQRQTEELQAQQEELMRNNEELEQQAESLRESQARLENQQTELEEANTQLEEQALALESQREDLLATQNALQQQAAELARASRYKSEFLANMSHELRTPLNSSLILAKLLMDNREGTLSADQVQYATSIHAAGNDLLALIDDILDLSKVEAGKVELAIESVPTARIVEELEHRFAPLAAERRLDLRTELQPGCPERFETDPQRLRQVLTNLLSNALKFTHEGGIRLRVGPRGRRIAFRVEDTGVGILAEQHEVIFEAFRQADGTTHRKYGGTGLGLSICRELVALLGGEIELESAPGEGSAFTVLLPVRAERTARSAPPHAPRPHAPRPPPPLEPAVERSPFVEDDRRVPGERVVLIVEDDPAFARILRDLGRELSFRCIVARDAAEGLALARAYRPVAVVLDVGLPDHSGLTVLELMKRDPATRHVPIHVVSVHDHEKVARELGAVGYALKPVERDRLAAAFRVLEERLARTVRAVLVVEDDPVQCDAITRLLRADDVDIVAVGTAEAALEQLRASTFDCCVLDLMLPDVSGFELLDRMSEDTACSFPPVIVYTARPLTPDEEQRLRRSSSSIIVKGARSPERLLEEVTLFLHKIESELPAEQRRMLAVARDRDRVFDGRSVLLVEDDVRTIFALAQALELRGLSVQIARNGKEALARLEKGGVDIVLMDVMMPEMDGLAAMRAIRADGRWSGLPVLALTAKAMPDDRQDCLQAGANDYIAKPIDVDKLMSLLRVWMPR